MAGPKNAASFAYVNTDEWEQYAFPSGMLITGRGNYDDDNFQKARDKGCEVLRYVEPNNLLIEYVKGDEEALRRGQKAWPWPQPGTRKNYYDPNTKQYCPLADISVGSSWIDLFVARCADIMVARRCDGLFLDTVGERLWSKKAAWESWPQWERDEWTAGQVNLVHLLRIAARQLNPGFILMNNNDWGKGYGRLGEQFVNGRSIEHHEPNPYQIDQAARPYGVPEKRRVLAISKEAHVQGWLSSDCTHVSNDMGDYKRIAVPPPCGFVDLREAPPS